MGGGLAREVAYALCDDRRTLLWFANQRAVEYHPSMLRVGEHHAEQLVLDLDPPPGADFASRWPPPGSSARPFPRWGWPRR